MGKDDSDGRSSGCCNCGAADALGGVDGHGVGVDGEAGGLPDHLDQFLRLGRGVPVGPGQPGQGDRDER